MKSIIVVTFALVAIAAAVPVEQIEERANAIQAKVVQTIAQEINANIVQAKEVENVAQQKGGQDARAEKVAAEKDVKVLPVQEQRTGKALREPHAEQAAKILSSRYEQNPDGSYDLSFETDNGIKKEEVGELKEVIDEENNSHKVVVMRGSYSYIDNEGNIATIHYYADETGFHAEGPGIPKEVIARK